MSLQESTDCNGFDPEEYIKAVLPTPKEIRSSISIPTGGGFASFLLKHLASHYAAEAQSNQKILDYGCGSSIPFSISAAARASKLVLAEYAEQNREHLKKWLDGESSAHDWSPYFKYVVEILEERSSEVAIQREEEFRNKARVISCDINKESFIEESDTYDTVMSFLCLDSGCRDTNAFKAGMKKLASLVKDGGYLLLCTTRRENSDFGYYTINSTKISNVALKRDFIIESIKQSGLRVIIEDYLELATIEETRGNSEGFFFFKMRK
jgi:hypothetical protein